MPKNDCIYMYLPLQPMGDIILPQLKDKVEKITLLRDGSAAAMVTHWGFELLRDDELRIRHTTARAGDMLRIKLKN